MRTIGTNIIEVLKKDLYGDLPNNRYLDMKYIQNDLYKDLVGFESINDEYKKMSRFASVHYDLLLKYPDLYKKIEDKRISKDDSYKETMKSFYKKLSNKNYKKSYKYYEAIRNTEKKCGYCGFAARDVTQIDHFFPQALFPSLALTIRNFVPSCSICNERKLDTFYLDINRRFISPYEKYFEDVFDFLIFKIEKISISNHKIMIKGQYSVLALDKWNDKKEEIKNRINNQLKFFGLDELYSVDFLSTYDSYLYELREGYFGGNLKRTLEIKRDSYRNTNNIAPWLWAGYDALIDSKEFIDSLASELTPSNNICPNCESKVVRYSKFCSQCGLKLI